MKAGRLLNATLERDVDGIVAGFCQADWEELPLNRTSARLLVTELIFPRTSVLAAAGPIRKLEDPKATWGVAYSEVVGPKGRFDQVTGTIPTEGQPCMPVEDWLRMAWRAEANGTLNTQVLSNGLRKDRAKLESLGIKKLIGHDGESRTLGELQIRFDRAYAESLEAAKGVDTAERRR